MGAYRVRCGRCGAAFAPYNRSTDERTGTVYVVRDGFREVSVNSPGGNGEVVEARWWAPTVLCKRCYTSWLSWSNGTAMNG